MSYSDFERGIPSVPFCQRQPKPTIEDHDLLSRFKESERRLKILRFITGGDHEPTEAEMKRWIAAVKQ